MSELNVASLHEAIAARAPDRELAHVLTDSVARVVVYGSFASMLAGAHPCAPVDRPPTTSGKPDYGWARQLATAPPSA